MIINTKKTKTDVIVHFTTLDKVRNHTIKLLGSSFNIALYDDTVFVNVDGVKTGDDWRELGFGVIQYLNKLDITSASITHPKHIGEFVEGLYLGNYSFTLYKSKDEIDEALDEINEMLDDDDELKVQIKTPKNIDKVLEKARAKAEAQNMVRDMVNGTPEDMNSRVIAGKIEKTFKDTDVRFDIYDKQSLYDLGMNGHLAVNRASRHPAYTVKLEYKPKRWKKHIVLVGKGLTYDSGGLSIKPGSSMTTMKADKGGAMAVYGIMKAIADLGCKHKVTAYLGLAENMIDGSAYKPDDVITMKNGKTVHIKNTDAEGRVVLFDNLCLAEEENPNLDEIYTFATLTGAAVYQFGNEAAGMVGFNDDMKAVIKEIGEKEGEIFCNAEFHKYMMSAVDDDLADLSNTGTPNQGCQKAGLFLTNALTDDVKEKYLHLDIAGPAFVSSGFGSNKSGATGFSVRTFVEYLKKGER